MTEIAAQLKRQEGVINSLTVTEYKAARDAFASLARNPNAASAQAGLRDRLAADIKRSIFESLTGKHRVGLLEADVRAASQAKAVLDKLAALHDPDMVAGGWMHPNPTGVGRAGAGGRTNGRTR